MADLDAIRQRLTAATPGPWGWEQYKGLADLSATDGSMVLAFDHDHGCGCRKDCTAELALFAADADLIAHAPTDLAALCDEVERLRGKEDDLTEVAMHLDGQRVDALEEAERLRDWQNEVIGALLPEELDDNEHRAEIALETLTRHMSDLNTRVADVALLRATVARVRALLPETGDWEHTDAADWAPSDASDGRLHGDPDCAGCWSERLRAALDGGE